MSKSYYRVSFLSNSQPILNDSTTIRLNTKGKPYSYRSQKKSLSTKKANGNSNATYTR